MAAARKKKTKKKRKKSPIGRRGPAQNLRPAGAHHDRRRKTRARIKVELQQTSEDMEATPPATRDLELR